MSPIGPSLPPDLHKRKHSESDSSDNEAAPATPPTSKDCMPSKRPRVAGPLLPHPQSAPSSSAPTRKVHGPAPPPAPLDQRPDHSPSPSPQASPDDQDSDSDSSSSDYGPALPTTTAHATASPTSSRPLPDSASPAQPKRDAWMLAPPTSSSSLSARMDPTKPRARAFASGRSAQNAGSDELSTLWTETPEQKRKRLADEVLGVSGRATDGQSKESEEDAAHKARKAEKDAATARAVREYDEKFRGKSLYAVHQERVDKRGTGKGEKADEDDPSKRAWDYEKDMGGGRKIGSAARSEMVKKAAGFGSRFTKGSYS